jgi:hypothetical protein
MLLVSAWVDDLKRMQRRMADLCKQHRKAEACDKHIASLANECKWPGNSHPSLRLPTRSHELSRMHMVRYEAAPFRPMTILQHPAMNDAGKGICRECKRLPTRLYLQSGCKSTLIYIPIMRILRSHLEAAFGGLGDSSMRAI